MGQRMQTSATGGLTAVGIVLAGGASRRLQKNGPLVSSTATGPIDKALFQFRGRTFLEHVCASLADAVAEVIVVAAPHQTLPVLAGAVRVVRDGLPGAGPLAGIRDGMRSSLEEASRLGVPPPSVAFIASCDVPLLNPLVVRHLIQIAAHTAVASSGIAWALPWVDAHRQVLVSAASLALLPQMEAYLASGRRDPQGLVAQLLASDPSPIRLVTASELTTFDPALASFFDIDTADDFERLQTLPGYPPSRN